VIQRKNFQVHYTPAVGLVMNSIENKTQSAVRKMRLFQPKVAASPASKDEYQEERKRIIRKGKESTGDKIKDHFDRYVDKIKDF
jgi:cell division protein FtsA